MNFTGSPDPIYQLASRTRGETSVLYLRLSAKLAAFTRAGTMTSTSRRPNDLYPSWTSEKLRAKASLVMVPRMRLLSRSCKKVRVTALLRDPSHLLPHQWNQCELAAARCPILLRLAHPLLIQSFIPFRRLDQDATRRYMSPVRSLDCLSRPRPMRHQSTSETEGKA